MTNDELEYRLRALETQLENLAVQSGSTFALIDKATLSASGLITFPASGSLTTAYKHLLVAGIARSVRAGQYRDTLGARFGTGGGAVDSGANYTKQISQLTNVTLSHSVTTGDTSAACGQIDAASANANAYSGVYVFIPHYQSSYWKTVQWLPSMSIADNTAANMVTMWGISWWRNTGAISSMTFGGLNAWDNLAAGSSLSLYGLYG